MNPSEINKVRLSLTNTEKPADFFPKLTSGHSRSSSTGETGSTDLMVKQVGKPPKAKALTISPSSAPPANLPPRPPTPAIKSSGDTEGKQLPKVVASLLKSHRPRGISYDPLARSSAVPVLPVPVTSNVKQPPPPPPRPTPLASSSGLPPKPVRTSRTSTPVERKEDSPPKEERNLFQQHHCGVLKPETAKMILQNHFKSQVAPNTKRAWMVYSVGTSSSELPSIQFLEVTYADNQYSYEVKSFLDTQLDDVIGIIDKAIKNPEMAHPISTLFRGSWGEQFVYTYAGEFAPSLTENPKSILELLLESPERSFAVFTEKDSATNLIKVAYRGKSKIVVNVLKTISSNELHYIQKFRYQIKDNITGKPQIFTMQSPPPTFESVFHYCISCTDRGIFYKLLSPAAKKLLFVVGTTTPDKDPIVVDTFRLKDSGSFLFYKSSYTTFEDYFVVVKKDAKNLTCYKLEKIAQGFKDEQGVVYASLDAFIKKHPDCKYPILDSDSY